MIDLKRPIERIRALLNENTDASVTYAALEARLTLEMVCYDRLRQCHDYISHNDLKRWQPNLVMNILINEVDEHAAETRTISMGSEPAREGVELKDEDFVEIGTVVGFDPKLIGRMWNALAGLALHVRLPRHKKDQISNYGDRDQIAAKVNEVLAELERLSTSTMTFSGFGEEVSFECDCGTKNKRRASLLRDKQPISCINPECKASWTTHKTGDDFTFQAHTATVKCEKCSSDNMIQWRLVAAMKYNETGSVHCRACNHKNYFQWRLTQVRPDSG